MLSAATGRWSCTQPLTPPRRVLRAAGSVRPREASLAAPAPAGLLLVRRPRVLVHVEAAAAAAAAASMGPRVTRSRAALPPAASCPAPRPRAERRAPRCSPPACSHARPAPAAPALTPPPAAARSMPPPADLRAPPPYPGAGRGGAAAGRIWPGRVRRRRSGGELGLKPAELGCRVGGGDGGRRRSSRGRAWQEGGGEVGRRRGGEQGRTGRQWEGGGGGVRPAAEGRRAVGCASCGAKFFGRRGRMGGRGSVGL